MNKYTMNDNMNIAFGESDKNRVSDEQKGKSFKRLLGKRDQHLKSNDSCSEGTDDRLMPSMNIHGAVRAFEQLMLHRQTSKQLSNDIIKVYTEMLQVDGACIYKCTTEGTLEVVACNATWSNTFSTPEAAEEVDGRNILLNPVALFPCATSTTNLWEMDRSSKAIPLPLGAHTYGSIISLPLICDGTTVGAISLLSARPQFFLPERIDVLRTVASLTASLYMNINVRNVLEKEQIERISLQKDIQMLREQRASRQRNTDIGTGADAVYDELEALSFSVSHDLRGPILTIRNICDWLSTQHAANLDTEGHALLRQITASSEHMEKLLDGLLAFSKVVQLDPQQSLIDMTTLVHAVVDDLLKCEGGSSSLSIAIRPLIPAYGDATLVRQVWYNLLSNAFKYTRYKQKREVTIDSQPFNEGAKYCVSDNGVGFDMQYVDRLFGAFHRLHAAEEFEGTGVGLAIVQRIVRRHGGQVWAEGKVDTGARFSFTLPKTTKTISETIGIMQ
ncbi:MAG: ATP-binding protein [Ignavibacteriales bacterium]|nr:ATP-binding protein [Ignavibacteriales bacterium]